MPSPPHVVVERLLHEGVKVASSHWTPDPLSPFVFLLHVNGDVVRRVEDEAADLTRVLLRRPVRRLAMLPQIRSGLEAARTLGALEEHVVGSHSGKEQEERWG